MTTIGPSYGRYVPPPAPPAVPPPLTNPDEPHTLDVVIVTASRSRDSTAAIFRQAYGGLTGAQENSRRNEEWAMSSPSQRVEAMGMSASALAGEDLGQDEEFGIDTIGTIRTDPYSNPVLESLGVEGVQLSNRTANHIVAKHSLWWPGNGQLPSAVTDAASLQGLIIAPALSSAHRLVFHDNGKVDLYADLPLAGRDQLGLATNTYKLVLGPSQVPGELRVVTAFPVVQGSGR